MRLTLTTPFELLVEAEGIQRVRGADASGAFAILPGHTDFVTVLAISVLSWRDQAGVERLAALRGGVFTVSRGTHVRVATPEAVLGDDLPSLERSVLSRMRARERDVATARRAATQLERALVRQAARALIPGQRHRILSSLEVTGPEGGPGE